MRLKWLQEKQISMPATRILKVNAEALTGLSQVCTLSERHCSLKAVSLTMAPTVGTVGGT